MKMYLGTMIFEGLYLSTYDFVSLAVFKLVATKLYLTVSILFIYYSAYISKNIH